MAHESENMANPEHLQQATYAVAVFNRWRDNHPDVVPDLSGADLSKALLRKGKLSRADLSGADLRRTNLREADLHEASLKGADLSKTNLLGADLRGADLSGADLSKATLANADLSGAKLQEAVLAKTDFGNANLEGAELTGAKLAQTDLQTARGLTQAQVDGAQGDSSTRLPKGIARPAGWPAAHKREAADEQPGG